MDYQFRKEYYKQYRKKNFEYLKEYSKQYHQKNKERIKNYYKQYYHQKREKYKLYKEEYNRLHPNYDKQYYLKNRERHFMIMKQYRFKNKDKIAAIKKLWYFKNIDKIKKRRLENQEKIKEYNKKYYQKNKEKENEKCRNWYFKNGKDYNVIRQKRKFEKGITKKILLPYNGRSKLKGYEKIFKQRYKYLKRNAGDLSIKRIQQVYEDNIKFYGTLTCYLCLKPIEFRQDSLEHKIPLSRGGTNKKENLAIAHNSCNSSKGKKTEEEYRKYERSLKISCHQK